ncbi:hypothetical protein WJX72_008735 [[Myrmecia] bisecta]|uniref:SHSP domain-containing protein n=1 Tax=[Myrmecia] bisecta TaxID=41462 RepID=A0AAW1PBY6_9CHLO
MQREMDNIFFPGQRHARRPRGQRREDQSQDVAAAVLPSAVNAMPIPFALTEDDDNFYITADLPGLRKEDIQVGVDPDNVLTISGERKPGGGGMGNVQRQERPTGAFTRSFQLPDSVDPALITANTDNGVLVVLVPKGEEDEDFTDIPVQDALAHAKDVVDPFITNNPIALFTKSYCPFSKKAKYIMDLEVGPDQYKYMDIDLRPDMVAIQQYLGLITGGTTVPRIFIKGTFIGGSDELEALARSGQLSQLVKKLTAGQVHPKPSGKAPRRAA